MPQVTVTIDGKQYRMACDEGQEQHLIGLASRFDRYVSHLKESFGEIGDSRLTVMAGIMIMDEMAELQNRVQRLKEEVEASREERDHALHRNTQEDAAVGDALVVLAERMEHLAQRLGSSA